MSDRTVRRLEGSIKLLIFAAWMAFASSSSFAQTSTPAPMAADAHPSFEVATIKPSDPNNRNQNIQVNGHRIHIENGTVKRLIIFAYAINEKQIANEPVWFDNEHYDIDGVSDAEGELNLRQFQEMLQELLADRFQLKFHREKRELSVYAVTVLKSGPKLTKSTSDPNGMPDATGGSSQQGWKFTNASMADFALVMQSSMDRPVVDQTGLIGKFDFTLRWTPDNVEATDPNAPPGLFTAIQEQLGLKLEPVKALADVLVIEHAEKPSAN